MEAKETVSCSLPPKSLSTASLGQESLLLCISNFLEEISSFSYSIVFIYALIPEKGFLMSPCYSLEFGIRVGISFLFSFAFASLLFIAVCKASSDNYFAF